MEPYLQSVLCPSLSKVLHSAMLHSNFFTSFFKLLSPPLFPACRSLCLSEDIKKLFLKFTNFAFPFNGLVPKLPFMLLYEFMLPRVHQLLRKWLM